MYPKCSTKTEREKTFSAFRHARTDCPESAFVCFKHKVYIYIWTEGSLPLYSFGTLDSFLAGLERN